MSVPTTARRSVSALVAVVLALAMLVALPWSQAHAAGPEMTPRGDAAGDVTITDVSVYEEDTKTPAAAFFYGGNDTMTWDYDLVYTFNSPTSAQVGGKSLVLTLPEALDVQTDTTPMPFMINGQRLGTYTLDGETKTVHITFDESVNDLQNGNFTIRVTTDPVYLADKVDQTVQIGTSQLVPVKKYELVGKHPVNKAGSTAQGGDDPDASLADNQVKWSLVINQLGETYTEPFTVEDTLQSLGGVVDFDYLANGMSGAANPAVLTVAELADGNPQPTGITIPLNDTRDGFSYTFTPDMVSGRTYVLMYRETVPGMTAQEIGFAPNHIEIAPTADLPDGHSED